MSRTSVVKSSSDSVEDVNMKKEAGRFTFSNGDTYDGGYMIVKDKKFLSRQGRGIYVTGDFNKYEAFWVEDEMVNEVNICHNNGTQYKGTLGIDGGMSGFGRYTFADNSCLEAIWEHNKPVENITLKDPLGTIWRGECDGKEISFTAGNHFWDAISPSMDQGNEKEDEKDLDVDASYIES